MKYLFSRIFNMNFNCFFETVNNVHKLYKKNRLLIFFDIIICAFKYKSGYVDYLSFRFYDLNDKQRKIFLTRENNHLIERKQLLVEEVITQHEKLNYLHLKSVNTIRSITISQGENVSFVPFLLRIRNGKLVDNVNYIAWDIAIKDRGPVVIESMINKRVIL